MSSDIPIDFSQMLAMLSTPEAFPDAACKETQLSIIQTHASAVRMVGEGVTSPTANPEAES